MTQLPNALRDKARAIKLVVFDVDGVLTDGTLVYSADGEQVKHFNVKDGVGIKLLNTYGILTAVISAKESGALARRVKDLGIEHYFPASKDKWAVLTALLEKIEVAPEEVCFVGDDVIDLNVMKRIGLAIAPRDAFWMVRDHSHIITESDGGRGVARDVADIILGSRMPLEEAYIQAMLPEFENLKS